MSHFNQSANQWDRPEKIETSLAIVSAMKSKINLNDRPRVMDFGCGTGLLAFQFANDAKEIVGIDTSSGMLDVFNQKALKHKHISSINLDLESNDLNEKFDLIISSTAFHHLNDPCAMMGKFKNMLNEGGQIALVDFDKEDGTFHSDNTAMGVKHFGFSKDVLLKWAKTHQLNFQSHDIIHSIHKNDRDYGMFCLVLSK